MFEPFLFVLHVSDKLSHHVVFNEVGVRDRLTHIVFLFDVPLLRLHPANKRSAEYLRTHVNRLQSEFVMVENWLSRFGGQTISGAVDKHSAFSDGLLTTLQFESVLGYLSDASLPNNINLLNG